MTFHIVTIFPEFFRGPFDHGVVAKAREAGIVDIRIHDLRDWTFDRHRTVDDRPFGGGEGMLMKPEPLFLAIESLLGHAGSQRAATVRERSVGGVGTKVALLSASGRKFEQSVAREYARCDRLVLICGRYEGVDERVAEFLADDELSIGDYVLSGGELAAAVVVDAVARLLPGVLGNGDSAVNESFSDPAVLDCPQYTRPADFRGWKVPEALTSGNHERISRWRKEAALQKTARKRPELLRDSKEEVTR